MQINVLNGVIACVVLAHWIYNLWPISCDLGSIFLHSIFVENTELHIGPRPKNSIYSGGHGKILKKRKI
jgi:hypothetical protein